MDRCEEIGPWRQTPKIERDCQVGMDTVNIRVGLSCGIQSMDIRKFGNILRGHAELTPFEFEYGFPGTAAAGLRFKVIPHLAPPTNIHTIIGRNGVGKTRLIRSLTRLLCDGQDIDSPGSRLRFFAQEGSELTEDGTFANLINVAFSAFDQIELPNSSRGTKSGIRVSYIGLRRPVDQPSLEIDSSGTPVPAGGDNQATQLKSIGEMTTEFVDSCLTCIQSSRRRLWLETMRILESDPLFATMGLQALPDCEDSAKGNPLGDQIGRLVPLCRHRAMFPAVSAEIMDFGRVPAHS